MLLQFGTKMDVYFCKMHFKTSLQVKIELGSSSDIYFDFILPERMKEISQSMPDSSDDLTLLKQYHQEWVVYRDQCKYLPGPFRSLEEELLNDSETGEETSIYQILLLEWGNILEKYEKRLCKAALELIKQERDGQIQDNQEYVISLYESFRDLSDGKSKRCNSYGDNTTI